MRVNKQHRGKVFKNAINSLAKAFGLSISTSLEHFFLSSITALIVEMDKLKTFAKPLIAFLKTFPLYC